MLSQTRDPEESAGYVRNRARLDVVCSVGARTRHRGWVGGWWFVHARQKLRSRRARRGWVAYEGAALVSWLTAVPSLTNEGRPIPVGGYT